MNNNHPLAEVLALKKAALETVHDAAITFMEASNYTKERHISALLVMGIVQETDQELEENQEVADLKTVVLSKGQPDDFGLMFDQLFERYPQLFAMLQQAVVNHVGKHYRPDLASENLKPVQHGQKSE